MDFLHLGGIFGNSGKLPGKLPGNLPGKRSGNLHVLPALTRNLRNFPDFIKFNTIFEIFVVFDSWPPGVVVHAGYCAHSYVTQQCALHVCACLENSLNISMDFLHLGGIYQIFQILSNFIRFLRFSLFLAPGYETPYALGTFE